MGIRLEGGLFSLQGHCNGLELVFVRGLSPILATVLSILDFPIMCTVPQEGSGLLSILTIPKCTITADIRGM